LHLSEVKFEAALYRLIRPEPDTLASRLLYHRVPEQHNGLRLEIPRNIVSRRLFLFERRPGGQIALEDFDAQGQVSGTSALPLSKILLRSNVLPRPRFSPKLHKYDQRYSTMNFRLNSLHLGFASVSLNRTRNRYHFPLLQHGTSLLLFSSPRSRPRLEKKAI